MPNFKDISSEILFDALINAPVSDREWAKVLVDCASRHQTIAKALVKTFSLGGLYLSPNSWLKIDEAAQRLNPKPPEFRKYTTSLLFICNNFNNASRCIFEKKYQEAVDWIVSGKDKKRVVMPKKKSVRPKKMTCRFIIHNFRERDDRTAWNKCK
jgi:hypothetical protein